MAELLSMNFLMSLLELFCFLLVRPSIFPSLLAFIGTRKWIKKWIKFVPPHNALGLVFPLTLEGIAATPFFLCMFVSLLLTDFLFYYAILYFIRTMFCYSELSRMFIQSLNRNMTGKARVFIFLSLVPPFLPFLLLLYRSPLSLLVPPHFYIFSPVFCSPGRCLIR